MKTIIILYLFLCGCATPSYTYIVSNYDSYHYCCNLKNDVVVGCVNATILCESGLTYCKCKHGRSLNKG